MKKIIILLIVISFTIAVEHVVQTYENGMPQVIKVYNSYGNKLSLIKETGYYSDGSKQYEMKYNNGKIIFNNRWSIDGKKEIDSINWTLAQKKEAQEGLCKGAPSQEACDCVIEVISKGLSFNEFKILDKSKGPSDPNIDKNLKERAMSLKSSPKFQECVSKALVQKTVPNIQELQKLLEEGVDNSIKEMEIEPAIKGEEKE